MEKYINYSNFEYSRSFEKNLFATFNDKKRDKLKIELNFISIFVKNVEIGHPLEARPKTIP